MIKAYGINVQRPPLLSHECYKWFHSKCNSGSTFLSPLCFSLLKHWLSYRRSHEILSWMTTIPFVSSHKRRAALSFWLLSLGVMGASRSPLLQNTAVVSCCWLTSPRQSLCVPLNLPVHVLEWSGCSSCPCTESKSQLWELNHTRTRFILVN